MDPSTVISIAALAGTVVLGALRFVSERRDHRDDLRNADIDDSLEGLRSNVDVYRNRCEDCERTVARLERTVKALRAEIAELKARPA